MNSVSGKQEMRTYLGDAVYVQNDGIHIILSAGESQIYLNGMTIDTFLRYLEKTLGLKIGPKEVEG